MKNTIKNTVNEVYDTNFSNVKKTSLNQVLNKIKTKPNNNISNSNISNNSGNNNVPGYNSSPNNYNSSNSTDDSSPTTSLFFPLLLVFLIIIGGLLYYFRQEINARIKSVFNKEKEVSKKVTVIKDGDEKLKEIKKKEKDKIIEEDKIKKDGKVIEEDKIKRVGNVAKEKKRMVNSDLRSQYSRSQIVDADDMYCYLGTDDNMRQCIQAYKDEICTSGDIYNRIDECLVPK